MFCLTAEPSTTDQTELHTHQQKPERGAEASFSHAAAGSGCWVLPQRTSNSPLYCLQEVSWSRAQTFDQN